MTTTVPSVEDVTNAFPTAVTKITGEPNYESLKNLKDELKANAASIPTTLCGGTHGYLGLILSPAAYATIAATQFIEPIYPGQHPNVPAGTSAPTPALSSVATQKTCANGANSKTSTPHSKTNSFPPSMTSTFAH